MAKSPKEVSEVQLFDVIRYHHSIAMWAIWGNISDVETAVTNNS